MPISIICSRKTLVTNAFGTIKSRRQEASGIAPMKDHNGVSITASLGKAEILNKQFSSVFNPLHSPTVPNINWRHPQMPRLDFSAAGIRKLLSDLDEHKATGSDNLSAKLLKTVGSEISPALELLFQSTYQQGVLPSDWRHARVTPIFKKEDRANAENYRPVSLTSIVCKIAEHIMSSQIHRHLDRHKILADAQHGFRKNRSCETQLLLTTNDLW